MAFDDIPFEIKSYQQWVCWEYRSVDNKQTKVPLNPITGHLASVTNPLDWSSFERARDTAYMRGCGIGFVFTKSDPFCGIDLDHADGDASVTARQSEIYTALNSYSEQSPSGNGLHIIVKAELPGSGRHPKGFGIFDNKRFFTFTGNSFYNAPIEDRQSEAVAIWDSLGSNTTTTVSNEGNEHETYTDADIIERASRGGNGNGDLFTRLWSGDWQTDYGATSNAKDKSQSAADLALVNIIAFYSRNVTQTVRMFLASGLGQREKAKRPNYVEKIARKAMPREVSITSAWAFDATEVDPWVNQVAAAPVEPAVWVPGPTVHTYLLPAKAAVQASYAPDDPFRPLDDFADPVPPIQIPGLVGELTAQCWNASHQQVAEVSIAAALSTMSLLCSRAYSYGSLGLPLYMLVLAQTSTGKSFGYKANEAWFTKLLNHYRTLPGAEKRLGDDRAKMLEGMIIGDIGSAQGLAQHMQKAPSTLMHADEWVETLRLMASPNPPPNIAQMRGELLKLTEKSGPGSIYQAKKYSNRTGAAAGSESVDVLSASLSILATGTPEQFYNELTSTLLTSGLLPRFTLLEYEGAITRPNTNPVREIDQGLFMRIVAQFDVAYNRSLVITGSANDFINVLPADNAASVRIEEIKNFYTRKSQESNTVGDNMAGLYSRAKEHVIQIASLIAIGVNMYVPTIQVEYINIAMQIIQPMLGKLQRKLSNGETGAGDQRLEGEVMKLLKRMIADGHNHAKKYPSSSRDAMKAGWYTVSSLRNYCIKLKPFQESRHVSNTQAFSATLEAMVKYGALTRAKYDGLDCVRPN